MRKLKRSPSISYHVLVNTKATFTSTEVTGEYFSFEIIWRSIVILSENTPFITLEISVDF